jgi:serpin B
MAVRLLALLFCLCCGPLAAQPAASSSDLALRLLRRTDAEQNAAVSPLSLQTAFAMAAAGAKGETRQEITKGLALGDSISQSSKELLAGLADDGAKVMIANRLWPARNVALLPAYVELCQEFFGAAPVALDFFHTEGARKSINDWVSERTSGKIPELIKPAVLDPATSLVLTNAVFFQGRWEVRFDKAMTESSAFLTPLGPVTVPMMHQLAVLSYFEDKTLQAVRLNYSDSSLGMTILVPRQTDGWRDLREQLDADLLATIFSNSSDLKVDLSLPRFQARSSLDVIAAMRSLGIEKAFADADFSGISEDRLVIAEAVHEAVVEVNEEGTVAGAATAIVATRSMSGTPKVVADRPFLFVVSDANSDTVLFVGQVINPEAGR